MKIRTLGPSEKANLLGAILVAAGLTLHFMG